MKTSIIKGIGYYVPENIVKNKDLEKIMDTSDEWIQERTGIRERRWVSEDSDESTSSMGTEAAKKAIDNAGISPDQIDFIIFATLSPDYFFPGSGVLIQRNLGLKEVGALDIRNQCSGFIYALSIADQYIKSGMYKNILIVGSELHSGGLEKSTRGRNVSVIFGDGAGAVILQASDDLEKGIMSTHLHSEGKYAEELAVISPATKKWIDKLVEDPDEDGSSYAPYMNGNFVFKNAVIRFMEVINEALVKNNLTKEDIDLLIPHQASGIAIKAYSKFGGFNENKVMNIISKYGNCVSASIPLALCIAIEKNKINKNDLIMMIGTGAGLSVASTIIRY